MYDINGLNIYIDNT